MQVLSIFGSNTGNTTKLMQEFKAYFNTNYKQLGARYKAINASQISNGEVDISEQNVVILACSTWGIEPPVMQDDFAIFWQNFNKNGLKGRHFAVVGLGDSYYPHFCGAVDLIEDDILQYGGILSISSLILQTPWQDYRAEIGEWLNNLKRVLLSC